jgi:hypothetical protein
VLETISPGGEEQFTLSFGKIVLGFGRIVRAFGVGAHRLFLEPAMKTSRLHCSPNPPRNLRTLAVVSLALGLPLASLSAQQTYTWDNGLNNGLWGNQTNWVGDPSPLTFNNQTDLIFDPASVTNLANAIALGGARTIRSLAFEANFVGSTTATFDIRTLTTLGGTTAANLTFAAASGNASINVAQSTSGAAQIRLGASASATQNQGSIVLSTNLDLAQNNTFFGATGFQFDGKITGSGAINKTGLGEVRLVRDNSGWSGGMNINEGNVTIAFNPSAMGTGTWTLGGGATNTSLSVGSTSTYTNAGGLVVAAGARADARCREKKKDARCRAAQAASQEDLKEQAGGRKAAAAGPREVPGSATTGRG